MKTLGKILKSKIILWVAMIVGILPLIVISFYNRQNADDFTYTVLTHAAVLNHQNIFGAALQSVKYFMENWNGLYFSSFLQSLSWGIFGSKFCFMNTFIIILSLIIGISSLCYVLFKRILGLDTVDWKCISAFLVVYIMQTFPDPVQAMYWYNGAVNYTFMWSFFLLTLAVMLVYMFDEKCTRRKTVYIAGLILTILTIGGNHVVQGLLLGFSFLFSVYSIIKRKHYEIMLYFLCAIAGFVMNIISGGTESRWQSMEYDHNIVKTIIGSAATTVQWSIQWYTFSLVLLNIAIIILLKPAIKSCADRIKINVVMLIGIFVFSMFIVFCMNFIPTYAMGYAGSGRVTNIIYSSFVLLMIFNLFLCACWGYNKFASLINYDKLVEEQKRVINNVEKGILLLAICYVSLFGMGTCIRMPYGSTAVNAVKDIVSGQAKVYAAELDAREVYYAEHQNEDVIVEPLTFYPYILCFTDIEMDKEDYKNTYSSEFYGVKSITRKPDHNGE